jgi:hypothetical protein
MKKIMDSFNSFMKSLRNFFKISFWYFAIILIELFVLLIYINLTEQNPSLPIINKPLIGWFIIIIFSITAILSHNKTIKGELWDNWIILVEPTLFLTLVLCFLFFSFIPIIFEASLVIQIKIDINKAKKLIKNKEEEIQKSRLL